MIRCLRYLHDYQVKDVFTNTPKSFFSGSSMSPKTKKDDLSSPRSDENNPNQKPPFSYAQLIIQAISTAPERQEMVTISLKTLV